MFITTFRLLLLVFPALGASPETRIVGGENAKKNDFPQLVSLRLKHVHHCGATILTTKMILTAAHCVQPQLGNFYSIQYGMTHIIQGPNAPNVIAVSKLITHENYIPGSNYVGPQNDVAVGKLASPLTFSSTVQPVKLPTASKVIADHSPAVAAGWGASENQNSMTELQKVYIYVYSDEMCEKTMVSAKRRDNICAGELKGGKGICFGDSGGPVFVDGVQVGISSWTSQKCALKGYLGVFTRVSRYVDWIHGKMGSGGNSVWLNPFSWPRSILSYIYNLFKYFLNLLFHW